jgi:hypothetical protein
MDEITQIYWLFRCTEKQYAESFCSKGTIKLNTPKFWIELEMKEGKGRGDLLEGVYCSFPTVDIQRFLHLKGLRDNVKGYTQGNLTYLRSNDVIELPCFCLFGLYNHSFHYQYFKETGRYANVAYVNDSYFRDFYKYQSRESIECLPDKNKPVFVIIKSPNKFFERVHNHLETLGISKQEILINPVNYIDKKTPFLIRLDYPLELFQKDLRFKNQSELRIVINTKNNNALEQLRKQNYLVDIGDLSDITEIYKYYLEDMLIEMDGMTLRFNLPEPIVTKFEDMSKEELLGLAYYLTRGEASKTMSKEEIETGINHINQILKDKFGIYSYFIE